MLERYWPWRRRVENVPGARIERMMDEMFRGLDPFAWREGRWPAMGPDVDMIETEEGLKVTADLPGMLETDIDLSVEERMLIIAGEKKQEKEEKGKNFHFMERTYGKFRRELPLPCAVEASKVDAKFKDGVLNVFLPKAVNDKKQKKIRIRKD